MLPPAPADYQKAKFDAFLCLLRACRVLVSAMVTAWRWDRDDQLPDGHYWRIEGLNQVRVALDRYGMDIAG